VIFGDREWSPERLQAFLDANGYDAGRIVDGRVAAIGRQTFGKWRLFVDCDEVSFAAAY
jgi:hypothetical protein